MKDPNRTKANYKNLPNNILPVNKNKEGYIRKNKLINDFAEYNKKERFLYYPEHLKFDKIYNDCIIDTALELLENERFNLFIITNNRYYGLIGFPLPWSTRAKTLNYKYNRTEMSKQKLKKKMKKEVNTT